MQRGGGGGSRQQQIRLMKESVQTGHRTGLTNKLLDLFAPLPRQPHVQPLVKKKPALPYTGLAAYAKEFASPGDPEYEPPPPSDRPASPRLFRNRELAAQCRLDAPTKPEKLLKLAKWRTDEAKREVEENAKQWNPKKDPAVEGDPFKTLFIAGLSYDVTEKKLRREFEEYGPVKRIRLVQNKSTGKLRGYAFIEFEHKKDFKDAYKLADGKKIEGRRVIVDFEKGRTVDNWRPRRLGGGLGGEGRLPKEPKKAKGVGPLAPVEVGRDAGMGFPDRRDPRGERGVRDEVPRRDFVDPRAREPPPRVHEPPPRDYRGGPDRGGPGPDRAGGGERGGYGGRGGDRGGVDPPRGRDYGRPDAYVRGDRRPDAERDGMRDRERDRKRDRSRERERSPGRDDKRRHVEDGEVRGDSRRERTRERDM